MGPKRFKFIPFLIFVLLSAFIGFNIYSLASASPQLFRAKLMAASPSVGESYVGKLWLWQEYVLHNDWDNAAKLQSQLKPQDTQFFIDRYSPEAIKVKINSLMFASSKDADSWITLAQLYYRLHDLENAKQSLIQAQSLDPLREDISVLLRSLN